MYINTCQQWANSKQSGDNIKTVMWNFYGYLCQLSLFKYFEKLLVDPCNIILDDN